MAYIFMFYLQCIIMESSTQNNSSDLSNLDVIEQQVTNIILSEQRDVPEENVVYNQSVDHTTAMAMTNQESSWTSQDMLKRPILLHTFEWNVSDTRGTYIYDATLPEALAANTPFKQLMQFMSYYRGGFRVRIMINSTKFHAGRLLAYWQPCLTFPGTTDVLTIQEACNMPHIQLAADSSESVDLIVPFALPNSEYSEHEDFTLGGLHLMVMSPLATSSGTSQSIGGSIYIILDNPIINLPIAPTPMFREPYKPQIQAQSLSNVGSVANSLLSKTLGDGGVSTAMQAGVSAAQTFASIESGDVKGALEGGISTVEKGMSALGNLFNGNFDKPNENHFVQRRELETLNNPAFGIGLNAISEMNLHPNTAHAVPTEYLGIVGDEMDLAQLYQRPSLFNFITWSETDTTGSNLVNVNACPTAFSNTFLFGKNPSWLTYVSSMFTMWRGSMHIHLQFVGSQFHTGRLLVAFIPNQHLANLTSGDMLDVMQSPYKIWDVKENHEFDFDLPWNVLLPYLNCPSPFAVNTIGFDNNGLDNCSSGRLFIFVLNPLAAPNADVVTSADIMMWISGGSDMKFKRPRAVPMRLNVSPNNPISPPLPFAEPIQPDIVGQSLMTVQAKEVKSQPDSTPQHGGRAQAPDFSYISEPHTNLKDILRRSAVVRSHTTAVATDNESVYYFPVMPSLPFYLSAVVGPTAQANHWLPFWDKVYRFWSGKLDFKISIVWSGQPVGVTVVYFPDVYASPSASPTPIGTVTKNRNTSYATIYQNVDVRSAIEFSIPWSQVNPVCLTTQPNQLANANVHDTPMSKQFAYYANGTFAVYFNAATAANIKWDLWMAAGDDFQFYMPIKPPIVDYVNHAPFDYPPDGFGNLIERQKAKKDKVVKDQKIVRLNGKMYLELTNENNIYLSSQSTCPPCTK